MRSFFCINFIKLIFVSFFSLSILIVNEPTDILEKNINPLQQIKNFLFAQFRSWLEKEFKPT